MAAAGKSHNSNGKRVVRRSGRPWYRAIAAVTERDIRAGYLCCNPNCNVSLHGQTVEIDHVIPGHFDWDILEYDLGNLISICADCNDAKNGSRWTRPVESAILAEVQRRNAESGLQGTPADTLLATWEGYGKVRVTVERD